MYTAEHVKNLDPSKIHSIDQKVGLLSRLTLAKIYIHTIGPKKYYIVTRAGILNFYGCAQRAVIYGVKNQDFREYKAPAAAAKFLQTIKPIL
jgi:hypothetical protein